MSASERMIRELAYELWEHAGRPDGRSDEFWFAARFEFERREETGKTGESRDAAEARRVEAGRRGTSLGRGGADPSEADFKRYSLTAPESILNRRCSSERPEGTGGRAPWRGANRHPAAQRLCQSNGRLSALGAARADPSGV